MSDREMKIAEHYVTYLPEYCVMVCRKYKYALCPSKRSIGEHFCSAHKSMTKANKKAIGRYASKLLLKEAKDVINPLNDTIEPLPALELSKGFKCNSCPYMSKALRTMMYHCYQSHSYIRSKGIQWSRRYIQTFFPNKKRKYFSVNVTCQDDDDELDLDDDDDANPYDENATSSLDRLLEASLEETERREEERRRDINIVQDETLLVKMTPWLRRTRWPKVFKGRDMETLVNAIRSPDENEQGLQLVWESVARVMKRCIEGVNDVEDRAWDLIPFWLNSLVLNESDSKPFRTYITDGSVKKYTKTWQQLICFCIRALDEEDTYGIQFQSNQ